MGNLMQYAILILVAVSAVMAIASYFATRREVDDLKGRLVKMEDWPANVGEFVRQADCHAREIANTAAHEAIFAKVGGVERGAAAALATEIRGLREERRKDAEILHAQLGRFQEEIGGLKAASNLQTAQLDRMDKKLDNIQRQQG